MYCFAGGVESILQYYVVADAIISKQLFFLVDFFGQLLRICNFNLIIRKFTVYVFSGEGPVYKQYPGSRESHESGSFFLPLMHRFYNAEGTLNWRLFFAIKSRVYWATPTNIFTFFIIDYFF